MTIFSFRAECQRDVEKLTAVGKAAGIKVAFRNVKHELPFPDVDVEIESQWSLEDLMNLMRSVVDGHVMRQTLRPVPLTENSLERDRNIH